MLVSSETGLVRSDGGEETANGVGWTVEERWWLEFEESLLVCKLIGESGVVLAEDLVVEGESGRAGECSLGVPLGVGESDVASLELASQFLRLLGVV